MSLETALQDAKVTIRGMVKEVGLDFFEVVFEMVSADQMNAVAAYGGFPNRYPHWRFGMEYERLSKSYTYGFSKIYEMVVNNDPCYAYLMRANSFVEQKLVMAHVYGHSDFFKNNVFFSHTNRKMMDEAGNHRSKMQRLMMRHGQDKIEDFIDICLSLENLVDINSPVRVPNISHSSLSGNEETMGVVRGSEDAPPDSSEVEAELSLHVRPEKDVLLYLLERAPLNEWQQEVLSIIREEAYYFSPQRQSKIMNEGWASYWHSKLMTSGILDDSEVIDYADRHSGSMQMTPGTLNPYKVGIELFRDIELRWDQGRCGKAYEECDDMQEKARWNQGLGQGSDKVFEVRRLHNDVTFLDTFLTPEFCERMQLFTYDYDQKSSQYQINSRDFIEVKHRLLQMLTNGGNPVIGVLPSQVSNGELHLRHYHEGIDLKMDYARETLKNLYALWKRPIHIETVVEDVTKEISYDGAEHRERRIS